MAAPKTSANSRPGLLAGVTPQQMAEALTGQPLSPFNPFASVLPQTAYGRGGGFNDKQWTRFDEQQKEAGARYTRAAGRLNAAAQALSAGDVLSPEDKALVGKFEKHFGKGTGTAQNLSAVAGRYGKAAGILADEKAYTAFGYDRKAYAKLPDVSGPDSMMHVPLADRRRLNVNVGHKNFPVETRLLEGVAHEPHHGGDDPLEEQKFRGIPAYRRGNAGQRAAYGVLASRAPEQALKNPDHLAAFALALGK